MKEEKILIDDLKINCKIAGKGEPILILHGWGSSSDSWVEVSEILSKKFKVICPDLPGFGKSDQPKTVIGIEGYAKFLLDFTQKISLEKFNLIGHSFGGAIAFFFSISHPQKVKSLILCSPAIVRKKQFDTFYQKIKISSLFFRLCKKILSLPFLNKFYPLFRKIIYKITGSYDYYLAKGIMKEILKKVIREDGTIFLDKLEKETLILWGEKDSSLPLSDAFLLKERIKNSKLEVLKGVTHAPNLQAPQLLAEKILKFLEK